MDHLPRRRAYRCRALPRELATTRERLRFDTQAEADAAADRYREAGHSLYWIEWAESLQRFVTIPEE